MTKKYKINYVGVFIILISAAILSFIGMALPNHIASFNYGNIVYGTWASYFMVILLFYLLNMKAEIIREDE